ncbi:MAG: DUF5615 family PIN-like protein [Deltaproteobacteria bacterium]|nr:DUF5615 family PIN-like protein [Deltaproteobacteria bacterium]
MKPHLQQARHDVFTAADGGLTGKSDVEAGASAKSEGLMLFTLDLEFADLNLVILE